MSEASLDRLLILFSAGLGLMVLGGLNFLLSGLSRRLRMSIGGCAAIACTLAPLAIASAQVSIISFAVILLGLGLLAGLSSTRATSVFQSIATCVRRPSIQAAILIGSGVALMSGSLTHYAAEDEAFIDRDMDFMGVASARPPLHISTQEASETDNGNPIDLKTPDEPRSQSVVDQTEEQILRGMNIFERVIRVRGASDVCNCHGWVFTGGRYWLSPEDVEAILTDNDYQSVSDPRAGDVVIYRQGAVITHTAIVRSNTIGSSPLVEGKWGWMGVFLHRIDESPYGTVHEFYRSTRSGHILRGLEQIELE